jgi:hypothetical protein
MSRSSGNRMPSNLDGGSSSGARRAASHPVMVPSGGGHHMPSAEQMYQLPSGAHIVGWQQVPHGTPGSFRMGQQMHSGPYTPYGYQMPPPPPGFRYATPEDFERSSSSHHHRQSSRRRRSSSSHERDRSRHGTSSSHRRSPSGGHRDLYHSIGNGVSSLLESWNGGPTSNQRSDSRRQNSSYHRHRDSSSHRPSSRHAASSSSRHSGPSPNQDNGIIPHLKDLPSTKASRTTNKFMTSYDKTMAERQTKIETLPKDERAKQEEWAFEQLKSLEGTCSSGFNWRRIPNGYRCHGGQHLVTDQLLSEGRGGYYSSPGNAGRYWRGTPIWEGPWYSWRDKYPDMSRREYEEEFI